MKKLVLFLIFATGMWACEKKTVGENVFNFGEDNIITAAEKNLGTLVKTERKFFDPNSGSSITLKFAAKNMELIEVFLSENKLKFTGLNQEKKKAILSNLNIKNKLNESSSISEIEDNYNSSLDVVYDLVSVSLMNGDVGYQFSIEYDDNYIERNSRNAREIKGVSWCQQTSLPWCEILSIKAITESTPQPYDVYTQSRGVFWSGSGLALGGDTFYTNGSWYDIGIDGPKYTRVGGTDPVVSKFKTVVWTDLETNTEVIINNN